MARGNWSSRSPWRSLRPAPGGNDIDHRACSPNQQWRDRFRGRRPRRKCECSTSEGARDPSTAPGWCLFRRCSPGRSNRDWNSGRWCWWWRPARDDPAFRQWCYAGSTRCCQRRLRAERRGCWQSDSDPRGLWNIPARAPNLREAQPIWHWREHWGPRRSACRPCPWSANRDCAESERPRVRSRRRKRRRIDLHPADSPQAPSAAWAQSPLRRCHPCSGLSRLPPWASCPERRSSRSGI